MLNLAQPLQIASVIVDQTCAGLLEAFGPIILEVSWRFASMDP